MSRITDAMGALLPIILATALHFAEPQPESVPIAPVATETVTPAPVIPVTSAPLPELRIANIPISFIAAIKKSEGYYRCAYPDGPQYSIGWGTKATSQGECIEESEAQNRFIAEIVSAAQFVDRVNPNLDPGTRAALTSLTFNAGPSWGSSGLGDFVRRNDLAAAQGRFLQYVRASGQVSQGLVARRQREVLWFGRSEAP